MRSHDIASERRRTCNNQNHAKINKTTPPSTANTPTNEGRPGGVADKPKYQAYGSCLKAYGDDACDAPSSIKLEAIAPRIAGRYKRRGVAPSGTSRPRSRSNAAASPRPMTCSSSPARRATVSTTTRERSPLLSLITERTWLTATARLDRPSISRFVESTRGGSVLTRVAPPCSRR
jgi:hypothetical protein